MKTPTNTATTRHRLRNGLLGLALAAVIGGAATAPAFADDWRHDRRDAREHVWRDHDWRGHERYVYRPYAYVAPVAPSYGYSYAPPVYAAPSLSFGFSFR
jgi:hypothetical protein